MSSIAPDTGLQICLSALQFYPVYAGPALRFQRYAPGLRARGIQMHVFTCAANQGLTDGNGAVRGTSSVGREFHVDDVDGLPVTRAPVAYNRSRRFWWKYGRLLVQHCSQKDTRPDVIQLLTLTPWFAPSLARLKRLGIPLVYTSTMMPQQRKANQWQRAKGLLWRFPFRFVDCIVVSSHVMRDKLVVGGMRNRIEVIPNGVDLRRFRPVTSRREREELRLRLGIRPDSEVVLFIGHLNHRKGVDVLAESWELLSRRRPNAQLVLVSPSLERADDRDAGFVGRIMTILDRSGARDRVTPVGPVEQIEDYLRAADVFAFPSRREGMPNVVPEAFACGLSTVLAPFAGLPQEFGKPGEQYLLVERSPRAFASAVEEVLSNPDVGRRIGRQARAWVEETMSLERSLDEYAKLYRALAAHHE